MTDLRGDRKIQVARETQPRAPESNAQSGGMLPQENDPHAAFQTQAQRGGMNCALLAWAADQTQLTPHLQGILVRLVRLMDEHGALTLPQAQIAPAIHLGQTQTRAAIKALVEAGVIVRERRGSVGGGRQCDALHAKCDSIGTSAVSATTTISADLRRCGDNDDKADTTEHSTLSRNDSDDNAGSSPVDNEKPAHIEYAGARAHHQDNITTLSELNPETAVELFPGEKPRRKRTAYTPEFEAVWKLWPANRRGNSDKRLAFKRYQAGLAEFGAEKIEAAARRYLALPSTRKDGFQFCCLVEVFMNGKLEAAVEALDDNSEPAFCEPHERNGIRPRAF